MNVKNNLKFLLFLIVTVAVATPAFAQYGGKAEPKRITFEPGKYSKTLTGSLSNSQEAEFVFGALKGQTVTVSNATQSLFDFRVFSEENFPDGDFDSSRTYSFEIPETGDYMLFIRKKMVKTPRTARYSVTLTIK